VKTLGGMEGFKGPWAKWKQFCREGGGGREGGNTIPQNL